MLKKNVPYSNSSRKFMIKLKQVFREEFTIVGYTDGRGKDEGLIIYKCQQTANSIDRAFEAKQLKIDNVLINLDALKKNPKQFNVRPNGTEESRREEYEKMNKRNDGECETYFEKHIQGKLYSVGVSRFLR
ncbi:unnamed protein product [Ascophyllum nodosum]